MRNFVWCFCVLLSLIGTSQAGVDDAIVMVDGCSGVCVDPSGIVLTAKHCDLSGEVTIRFKQRTVKAVRVYESNDSEGPVAYDCEGNGYPALPVASTAPAIGEKLWSLGYPTLNGRRELRENCGPLLRWGSFKYAGGEFNGNVLGFSCSPGWSGGPLLNAKGEVCGLLNSSDDRTSVFISSAAVRQAYATVLEQRRVPPADSEATLPKLLVFGSSTCRPCLQFKDDLKSNHEFSTRLRSAFDLEFFDIDQRTALVKQYAIESVPIFVGPGGVRVEGYSGPEPLLTELGLIPRPDPRPPPVSQPAPEADTSPHPVPEKPAEQSSTIPPSQTPVSQNANATDTVDRLTTLASQALSVATWLGVTGISGGTAGAVLGGLALWRSLRKRRQSATPAGSHPANPPTITHDSQPLPQAIVPETRFAAYERDSHAEAFAWAAAEMARKYPGAVGTLESLQGLMNQYLASRGLRRTNKL